MKQLIVIPLLAISSHAFGQSVSSRIDAIMTGVLEEDGILLRNDQKACADCEWDECKGFLRSKAKRKEACLKKDQKLKDALLREFRSSIDINPADRCDSLFKYDISLAKLGSFIIQRSDTFVKVAAQNIPEFSILENGNQLGYENPDGNSSRYKISYNSINSFNAKARAELSGEYLDYFRAKMEVANDNKTTSKKHLNLAVGTFENELAKVFTRAKTGSSNPLDFTPLYELWAMYANGKATSTDAIIKSFTGLVYRSTTGFDKEENLATSASASGGYNAQFIKIATESEAQYKNSKNISRSSLSYKIEMFRKPDIETLPSPEQIQKSWTALSNRVCSHNETSTRYILPGQPLEITLMFGPVPDVDMALNNIELDEAYTLNKMPTKFISSIKPILNSQEDINFYDKKAKMIKMKIQITRDEAFIDSCIGTNELSDRLDIRLYYKHAVNLGTATTPTYLDFVYEGIPVATSLKPQLELDAYELSEPKEVGNFYIYDFAGRFKLNEGQHVSLGKPMEIFLTKAPEGISSDVKDALIADVKKYSKIRAIAAEKFGGSIIFSKALSVFGPNMPELINTGFVITFSDEKKGSFKRPVFVTLKGPKDQIVTQIPGSSVSFSDVKVLVGALDMERILAGFKYSQTDTVIVTDQNRTVNLINKDSQPYTFLEELSGINKDFKIMTVDNRYIVESKFLKPIQQ